MPITECLMCGINSEIIREEPQFCDSCTDKLERIGVNLRYAETILEETQ